MDGEHGLPVRVLLRGPEGFEHVEGVRVVVEEVPGEGRPAPHVRQDDQLDLRGGVLPGVCRGQSIEWAAL